MRAFILTSLLILMVCGSSRADVRAGSHSIFSGFSYANAGLLPDREAFFGVGANFAQYLGGSNTALVGDFSIQVKSSSYLLYVLGGVRQSYSTGPAELFVEGLAGISYFNPEHGESATCPALGGGGGIDWMFGQVFAVRAPQVDFLWGNHDSENFYDVRIQLGASFYF